MLNHENRKTFLLSIVAGVAALMSIATYLWLENRPAHSGATLVAQEQQARSTVKKSAQEIVANAREAVVSEEDVTAANAEYPGVTPQRLEHYFSPTLEGTDIDGELRVGPDGKLVVALEVKDYFDYFLSTSDIVTPEVAIEEMLKVAEQSLPPENFDEVVGLLNDYLAYKEQALTLMAQPMLPRDQQTREYQLQMMESTLAELRRLRRETMTPEAVDAFFGDEEAYEDYTLASIRVQFDDRLSQQEKAQRMEYLRTQLPEPIRKTEAQLVADGERMRSVQEALSAADEGILANELAAQGYTAEQQQEILEYHRAQADFDKRYEQYAAAKNEMPENYATEEAKEKALSQLRQSYFFNEQELTQARVRDLRS